MSRETMAGPDVLDCGARRRPWVWLLVAILVVAAGLWVDRRPSHPVELPRAADGTTGWVARAPLDRPTGARGGIEQLTFVDDRAGFVVQRLCSVSQGEPCPRRLLATSDGGRSWQPRGTLPDEARFLETLVAQSGTDLAFVGGYVPSTIAHSGDGGRTWSVTALSRGEPRPAPAGAPLVTDNGLPCPVSVCPPSLAWVDVAEQQLHRLPGQPATPGVATLTAAPWGPDGELVATAVGATAVGAAAWVWTSRDGGRSFAQSQLAVPLASGQAIWGVRALPAGRGRGYAFVKVATAGAPAVIHGFRSDDAGRSWADLGVQDPRRGMPAGVLAGELIGSDVPGFIQLSYDAGRGWAPGGVQVGSGSLTQQTLGGPVLATVVDGSGLRTYYQSPDGLAWSRVRPPAAD